jgi:hypothetical protein
MTRRADVDTLEKIRRVKEKAFLKRSSGQSAEKEERVIKALEWDLEEERSKEQRGREEGQRIKEEIAELEGRKPALVEKIASLNREWGSVLRGLARLEFEASLLFDERQGLLGRKGKERYGVDVYIGGMARVKWVSDALFPLSDELKIAIIKDRGEILRRRKLERGPEGARYQKPKFNAEMYEVFVACGIPVPGGWEQMYVKRKRSAGRTAGEA